MAIYINGIQDYIPQIQPFKPDFNFFQQALSTKQAQFEAGYNKINSIYGQLLNSNLLRESNKERRDAFFTQIDSEIDRLSGVDLSLAENVEQASTLFQPLIDNQYFRKDLVFTKQYEGQLAKANNMRNNPNPKSDEKYWEEGVSALNYQAEDFANATDEDSLRFQNPRYTPFINAAENLFKFAKDNDINIVTPDIRGGFIFKYTNGQPAIPTIKNVFSTLLAGDPRVKDMFRTQAYLDRKNYIQSNLERFGGDGVSAETEYLQNKVRDINEYYRVNNMDDTERAEYAKAKRKVVENTIKEKGVDPDLDQDLIAIYQNSLQDEQIQTSVLEKNKEALTQTDFMSYDPSDLEGMRQRVDGAMSYFLLDDLANNTATNYAMSHADIDIKEDPYTVLKVKHAYDMAKLETEFNYNKALKIMDVVGKMMQENGNVAAGTSFIEGYNEGFMYPIPGPGNVELTDTDIQNRNMNVIQSLSKESTTITTESINEFLSMQNYYIKNGSPEQKALAQKAVKDILGEYKVEGKTPEMTIEKDLPTDWGKAGMGLLKAGPGMVLAPWDLGSTVMSGYSDIWSGLFGSETEVIPEKITKTKGLAIRNSDGTYKLVDTDKAPEFRIEGSGSYHADVQKKMVDYIDQQYKITKDPAVANVKLKLQKYNEAVQSNEKLKASVRNKMIENNNKISLRLATDAGTDTAAAGFFFNKDKSGIRSENEFVRDYVAALKTQRVGKMASQGASVTSLVRQELSQYPGFGWLSEGPESEQEMIEFAQDAYEDLADAYEELKKNPNSELGLQSFDAELAANGGINRFFGTAAGYTFDSAVFNSTSFDMVKDFFVKDFMPNTASKSFMDEAGVVAVAGISGFDLTSEDLQDEDIVNEESTGIAINTLKAFLSSAMMNAGGKTGENQMRPTGNYFLHAVAANDGTKVAMTWDINPDWVAKHAGTEKEKGIAWGLQQKINEGKPATITFMMDADKAKSSPFTLMQSTKEEMLLNMEGKVTLDSYADNGGFLEVTRNAAGGLTYTGQARSVDATGKMLTNPIFGTTTSNINDVMNHFNNMFQDFAQGNMKYMSSLKENSQNKIYDPAQLTQ
jgi:hypothetical protein